MRARGGFRMVLYGEGRPVLQTDPFDGFIVQVKMGDLDIGCLSHRRRIYPEPMILSRDLASAGQQVLDGVIQPPMTMVHLEGGDIVGQCQELMAQTNTEQ